MMGDTANRNLIARLSVANERMRRLRVDAESAEHGVRIRVERHLEAAEEALGDLNVRITDLPAAGAYARRLVERDLSRVESEIVFAEAKLEAASAEEDNDVRRFAHATRRAMSAQGSALLAEIELDPHEHAARR